MRIAIIGDVHLGKAQKGLVERENDIYDLFLRICKRVIDEKAGIVCFLGDLFDSSHPPVKAISTALSAFENFARNGIKVILIAGNHDIPSIKTRMCPIELPKTNENMNNNIIELSCQNPVFKFNENNISVHICGVEYHPPEKRQSLIMAMENISSSILLNSSSEKILNILLLHQGLKEFSPAEEEISLAEIPNVFNFIFVGHLHLRMEKSHGRTKVILPGSIEIGSVSEVVKQMHNEAGIILINTETRMYEKVKISLCRKFIHKKFPSSAIDHELKNLTGELKESVVDGKLPWVYLEIEDDAKIGNSLINEKTARATEGNVLFVQKNIESEEMKEREKNTEISFKDVNLRDIIKGHFPGYNDEVYELYEKRKDMSGAKEVMNKIYAKFKDSYVRQKLPEM
ncbi:MAG: hypothetical protein GW779_01425 [Candidatus Altiarchaeum hamiconexum]|uniref:Calcineurin-like phosphoesterase domain-containing protein n=1 Tax=Candidatus Altarchaeum hamiconexum TaxID=1803513 RepID=A0A8J8CGP2_9ARCH|nr:hypothetical protein [Candidatus Altarchaeum hamiconexum]NCN68513.1 hypothetical protein [Candidatus Altarchaeum hamiconexum]NCS91071.1 hypothetical protein [Candidatus Altarchaeum hamiconexum]NCT00662.1 hypothetical protein [Candidatus Altarchaeum hamiconexum]OIQ05962.1 MAG: hypothetical protein AUK59_01725 [Candidatus Altarchaeum sp. CG2_30_32_3053]